jgi:Epoxide hydrolase N terminus
MTPDPATNSAVRSFYVDVGEEAIAELQQRTSATDRGVAGARARARRRSDTRRATRHGAEPRRLLGYEYDWRRCEATLNTLEHFVIDMACSCSYRPQA